MATDGRLTTPSDTPYLLAPPTRLLGRERELEAIQHMLLCPEVRLLTLTGAAGVGKTRLALAAGQQMADTFPQAVIFVDLARVRDAHLVLPTLARQLGVQDVGSDLLLNQLRAFLQDRRALLILDNFEQVLPAAAQMADLLATCPGIKLLVTSRSPLHLQWERTMLVAPLPVPDSDHVPSLSELAAIPSVALFLQWAQMHNSDFTLTRENARMVAELCVRLDGLPLAIELAAARMHVLPLVVIARRLEDRLQLLQWEAQDLPERHRSLHAAIDWSYELLTEHQPRLFRHLGVFVGRISLDAIDAVMGNGDEGLTLEGMASLAEKCLVLPGQQEDDEEPSFEILETMHEYALEQLDRTRELPEARTRHAQFFLELAERADPRLRMRGQRAWTFRLEREHDNLRTALRWLLDHGEREAALRLAGALGYFWWLRGYHAEGWRWLDEALRAAPDAPPDLRTKALLRAGRILTLMGDYDRSRAILDEALALAQQRQSRADIAQSLTYLGIHTLVVGERNESVQLLRNALVRWKELGDHFHIAEALTYLGAHALLQGDYEEAASFYSDALASSHAIGEERISGGHKLYLALVLRHLGDLPRVVQLVQEGLRVSVGFQDRRLLSLGAQAALWLIGDRADPNKRALLLGAGDALRQAAGFNQGVWERLSGESMATLRQQLEREGLGVTCRDGRSLSFEDTAALALAMLEDFSRTLARCEPVGEHRRGPSFFSRREQEVLRLVADGLADKQIARELAISERTVRRHVSSIFNKLGADNRPQAVALAFQRGLVAADG